LRCKLIFIGTTMMVIGCSQQGGSQQAQIDANRSAIVSQPGPDPFGWPILDRANRQVGIVATRLDKRGVVVTLDTMGLPAGLHGVHVHQVPKCEAPTFESAGAHWNWTHKKHGYKNPEGHHAGDLGNLTVAADGKGQATFVVAAKDWDPKAVGGWSLVIHSAADDESTDPSGNSGERIACGVFYLRRD